MLMTGPPIPLWYSERLEHPVVVKELTDHAIVLADRRSVSLPFIRRLPKNDPVFLKALKQGVELAGNGEVLGLIAVRRYCGNDPYVSRTYRINLSDLAGFMDPDGIDASIVPAEAIRDLNENESRSLDHHGLPFLIMDKTRRVRAIYEACAAKAKEKPEIGRTFRLVPEQTSCRFSVQSFPVLSSAHSKSG